MSLPTPPSSTDPANFAARADAFLGALPGFQVEMNALEANVEQMKDDTETAVAAANAAGLANAAANATAAQTARTGAETARTGAETARTGAETARDVALQAAADAEAAAGVIPPVSGNAGKVLKVNPTGTGTLWENADVRTVVEYLTSGTSWVAPAALVGSRVKYRMAGGGGGGGRASASAPTFNGGDAGYCEGLATVTPSSSYAYSIGAPGAAGASAGSAGGAGGNTTMFSATAGGGLGGPAAATTAWENLGGSASGGDINLPGGRSVMAGVPTGSAASSFSTSPPPLGRQGGNSSSGRTTSTGYGAGGTYGVSATAAQAGMPGVIILEYLVRV